MATHGARRLGPAEQIGPLAERRSTRSAARVASFTNELRDRLALEQPVPPYVTPIAPEPPHAVEANGWRLPSLKSADGTASRELTRLPA
jgi:hypothetical protein